MVLLVLVACTPETTDSGRTDASASDPVAPIVTLAPAVPTTTDDLTASADLDGVSWTWARNGQPVPEADGLSVLPASFTARGQSWMATATSTEGGEGSAAVDIVNTPPTAEIAMLDPVFPDALVAPTVTLFDADGDTGTATYAWTVNGLAAGEGATLDGVTAFDVRDVVALTVTPADDAGPGGAALSTSTVICGALAFDGTGSATTAATSWPLGDSFTLEAWIYPSGISGNYRRIVELGDAHAELYMADSGAISFLLDDSSNGNIGAGVTLDTWHHIAGVFDSPDLRLYVDGVLVASGTGRGLGEFSGSAAIGATPDGGFNFSGAIGPVRVSKTAKYAADFVPTWGWKYDGNALASWGMGEGVGDALDRSGSGLDAAVVNATWSAVACP